jgi:hypothetical protein
VTFEQIAAQGVEGWLAGLREDLVSKTYRPDPVRQVSMSEDGKRGAGHRPQATKLPRPSSTLLKLTLIEHPMCKGATSRQTGNMTCRFFQD